jgi:hypothetical protein
MSATDLSLCDNKQVGKPTDIVICDDKQIGKPSDIVICPDERLIDPCDTFSDLQLAGTATPSVGSTYSASGGLPPYHYSISQGSIDSSTGEITSLSGACGSGTVSVNDSCGKLKEMVVRFPVGVWNVVSDESRCPSPQCLNITANPPFLQNGVYNPGNKSCYSGNTWTYISWQYNCVPEGSFNNQCSQPPECTTLPYRVINRIILHEWECP